MGRNCRTELTEARVADNLLGRKQTASMVSVIEEAFEEYGITDHVRIVGPSDAKPRTITLTIKSRNSGTQIVRGVTQKRKNRRKED